MKRSAGTATAAVLLTLASFSATSTAMSAATPAPSVPVLPGVPHPPFDDGATTADINPNLVDVHPRPWDQILVAPDGRTLTVYFWNGPAACEGLADVKVTPSDEGIEILVYTGELPDAQACPDVVEYYRTVVVLDSQVFSGGSLLDIPSGQIGIRASCCASQLGWP
jgi:hypothetical protein